jgi:aminoglycoside 6-adenylyltransferase
MITYQALENTIMQWATDRPDVRAVLLIGSRAQDNSTIDQYSDLDLVIYTTRPAAYDTDSNWIVSFGEIWLTVRSKTDVGDREWLVLFAGGVKADFVIAPSLKGKGLAETLEDSAYADVFRRGVRVLTDRSGAASSELLFLPVPQSRNLPTSVEFELVLNRMILATARAAKFLRRGDLWRCQQQISAEVRQALLVLIEWHARLTRPLDDDIWYGGRFIDKWADPRVAAALPGLFASYDEADVQRALASAVDLSEWLVTEIAVSLEDTFPKPGQAEALSWVRQLLAW